MKKLLVSALEPSANLHLKPIVDLLKNQELIGIFDKSFGNPLHDSSEFSVMGFFEVLTKLKKANEALSKMANLSLKADHVLLIDSPAFNIPLARKIRKLNKNVKITYYILPKVWAWKENRVKKVEKYCTILASIFPFEDKFYNKSIYVGNPLLDEITKVKKTITQTGKIAYLPGSRRAEIKRLIDIFKNTAKKLGKQNIIVIPKHFSHEEIKELYGDLSDFEISRDARDALHESDFAFVCSGTATLEAAIIGTPQVLCYKAKPIDFFIAKRFVKLKHSGLANIIFDFEGEKPLHKEFFQKDVSVENLINEYETMDKNEYFKNSQKLRQILKKGSSQEITKLIEI